MMGLVLQLLTKVTVMGPKSEKSGSFVLGFHLTHLGSFILETEKRHQGCSDPDFLWANPSPQVFPGSRVGGCGVAAGAVNPFTISFF